MNFDEANWLAYREANMRFAEVVNTFVGKGDMVWVQVGGVLKLRKRMEAFGS